MLVPTEWAAYRPLRLALNRCDADNCESEVLNNAAQPDAARTDQSYVPRLCS